MHLIPLHSIVFETLLAVSAGLLIVVILVVAGLNRRARLAINLLGGFGLLMGLSILAFGVLTLVHQADAVRVATTEVQRVYHMTLVDEQVKDLLNDQPVQLNNGNRVELKQNPDGSYKLVQPQAPRDYPVGGKLAQG